MPPDEIETGDLYMMNENGEPTKIERFLTELHKKLDSEVIENLKRQIKAVDNVILGLQCCEQVKICPVNCPYAIFEKECSDNLFHDAKAIAEAYKRVVESGLQMMKER